MVNLGVDDMTAKMKAMVFTKYGSPDVLQLREVDRPTPKADEMLVKVAATAVNPADNHLLSGMMRFSSGVLKPKQQIPGSDIAGQIVAVGNNVTQFQPAMRFLAICRGRGGAVLLNTWRCRKRPLSTNPPIFLLPRPQPCR